MALTSNAGVEQKVDKKKEKTVSLIRELSNQGHLRARTRGEGIWNSKHMDQTVVLCILAHSPVHILLMKLMEIEPLRALSPFCSGGQLMPTQRKTKPSQPVSLPFIIVRATAAALPVSPQNPPSVCVCF